MATRVFNPHKYTFDGVPSQSEGEVPYAPEKAERFGLRVVKGKPGPKPKGDTSKGDTSKGDTSKGDGEPPKGPATE